MLQFLKVHFFGGFTAHVSHLKVGSTDTHTCDKHRDLQHNLTEVNIFILTVDRVTVAPHRGGL